ncbi:MAG: hypothetical protein V5A83_05430 [Candidatus Bipolaricaulota bacterium]
MLHIVSCTHSFKGNDLVLCLLTEKINWVLENSGEKQENYLAGVSSAL